MAVNTLCVELMQEHIHGMVWNEKFITDLRVARERWTVAHYPDEKLIALHAEKEARESLRKSVGDWGTNTDLSWLESDFLSASAPPANCDIRLFFPAPEGGWDIVVGNPPYQTPSQRDKNHGKNLGYAGASQNLYLMFIEVALNVVAELGCVTLVVPHSIVFGKHKTFKNVRNLIEKSAEYIDIRTYDNGPMPLFPSLPWLKGSNTSNTNRQRATILTFRKRAQQRQYEEPIQVRSRGLIRLSKSKRGEILKTENPSQIQPIWDRKDKKYRQWTQAPSTRLAELLKLMRLDITAKKKPQTTKVKSVTFPQTAMYFVSCLTVGMLDNPQRKPYPLIDDENFWPWIGLYNSHLFHAYWLMVGDAFHITMQDYGTVNPPVCWKKDNALRAETERLARRLLKPTTIEKCRSNFIGRNGKIFKNVNFHKEGTPGPRIIKELDRILLRAYRLPENPLMDEMRIIRAQSAHLIANK